MYEGGFSVEEAKAVAAAIGIDFSKVEFTAEAFAEGMNVELEHASVTHKEAKKTGHIALDHLNEDPKYYQKLKKVEKSIGLPSDMDIEHKYIYYTGFYHIKSYWWQDKSGNYIRYTNAPVDHPDFDPMLGEPLVHPEQPLPHTNPEYFTMDGFKRSQAVAPTLTPQRNPNYDPTNPKELWLEVVESQGLTRYIYRDTDLRENLDLWVQYQLRLADAALLRYRKYAYDIFKSQHPKDKVTGAILMLLDQGYFTPEVLVNLTVADLVFVDRTVILAGKKILCDDPLLDFFTSLTQGRQPEDPLFVTQTVHGRNSVGYNYLYAVLDSLKMDPNYLLAWHANHIFSKVLHRMSMTGVPVETAGSEVFDEVARTLGTTDDISFLIDYKVRATLMENYEGAPEGSHQGDVSKAIYFDDQDKFGIPMIHTDTVERAGDELQFSIWLHSTPMHDISPEEEAEIADAMAASVDGAPAEGEKAPPAAETQQPSAEGRPESKAPTGTVDGSAAKKGGPNA